MPRRLIKKRELNPCMSIIQTLKQGQLSCNVVNNAKLRRASTMKTQLEQRLKELKSEFQTEQKMLVEL